MMFKLEHNYNTQFFIFRLIKARIKLIKLIYLLLNFQFVKNSKIIDGDLFDLKLS
jgi:hypothetical protein